MSITLPFVDLSSAVVGTSGAVELQPAGLSSIPGAHPPILQIYNDSGAGLLITLKVSQKQFYLPPKGHSTVVISNKEGELAYQVVNIATNIQVNQLWTVYYYPDENISDFTPLGTSTVSQQATTLVNTGNAAATPIVFAEPIGDSNVNGVVKLTNDGALTLGDSLHSGSLLVNSIVALVNTLITGGDVGAFGPNSNQFDLNTTGTTAALLDLRSSAGTLDMRMIAQPPVTHNGSVSGSITLWQPFQGTQFKAALLYMNNYQDAANISLAFPAPFTNMTSVFAPHDIGVTGNGGVSLLNGVTSQSCTVLTTVAAAGGTGTTQNGIFKFSFASVLNPGVTIDHIQVGLMTSAHTGMVFILGN